MPRLRFAQRGLVLVVLCVASMTFAFDWGRIIFLAAPVFYVSAAWVVRDRRRAGQPEELAQAILSLLRDPERGRQMGAAGRRRVEQFFGIRGMIAQYEELYCGGLIAACGLAAGAKPQAAVLTGT